MKKLIEITGVLFLTALFIMLLWNWLFPVIFHLPIIGYWQALGLNIMSNILFKPTIKVK